MPLDKVAHSFERQPDFLIIGGVTHAHVMAAGFAERAARYDGDLLFFK